MSEAYIQLKSDRITVDIAKPGTIYAGSRFDWTGFITQVKLDNIHTFGAYESNIPGEGSGGIGFCNDFGLDNPIGYDEAEVGNGYLKVGIGTVRKPEVVPQTGLHMLDLDIIEKADISFQSNETEAVFHVVNPEVNGYKCELEKHISVDKNCVKVTYLLKNTGKKHIHTDEYMHNFMCIDGEYLGPNYHMSFLLKPSSELMESSSIRQPGMIFGENYITFSRVYEGKPFFIKGRDIIKDKEYSWRIQEMSTGCSVSETDSFVPQCMSVWGTKYVVAPESFIIIDLAPKEELHWYRVLTFDSVEK